MAKSLTRRANEPPRVQRRRGDTTAGGLIPAATTFRPIEMQEVVWDDAEDFTETLDCMNPWCEPGGYFEYGDDFHVPDYADAYFHLEL